MSVFELKDLPDGSRSISGPICVIGAGIAGLLLARRVAASGQKVIVVESGNKTHDDEVHRLNDIEDPAGRYSRALTGRYRGLGGTSSRWGGRMIPITDHEAGERAHIAQPGWPITMSRFSRYEGEIEEIFKVAPGSYEEIAPERTASRKMFPDGDATLTPRWAKCPSFKRCNVATVLKDELGSLKNIEIWLGATVCGFELDRGGGRLRGITARNFNGKELKVRADDFVFAAGTIETTRLLLLLDAASDNHAFARSRVLGRYFQDHLKAKVAVIDRRDPVATNRLFGYRFVNSTRRDLHLELSRAAQVKDQAGSAFAYVAMDLAESPLADVKRIAQGLQRRDLSVADLRRLSKNVGLVARSAYWRLIRHQLFVPAGVDLQMMTCVEQLPQWDNRIRLSQSRDRFGVPMALLEWAPTESDERTFRSAVANLAGYWRQAGLDAVCPLNLTPAAADTSTPIIAQAEACAHPSGSTRMGTDPAESVVGPDLRCHGVPNVAVVSASVFPTAGSANPTFTIMKMTMWLADSLLRRVPRPDLAPTTAGVLEPIPGLSGT
ncbi:Choline dehydrogenase [Mesorhizobium albiziae]|uniref:Choline dehydrogenase n=1 Tax=Neomesorhizobium albiziae TaxID=335020 RepID=A0A1I3XJI6_9HYPH|nr:GMC oxidoreductase [Mesorhizobium albiziae]GLS30393.1 hypothetical protein GCM10007937_21010 [Mesorhizobium albiziae]SFK19675.1 Choline dehydrogenase [Mesorhizobium albiziae]